MVIPAHVQLIGREEQNAVLAAMQDGQLIGNGPICKRVEYQLASILNVPHALLTPSCTSALELALITLGIGPGDEVIIPSFTFPSTANSVVMCGATPVYADIRPSTLNIDPYDIERRITLQTRAIIVMHYAGVACDMGAILKISQKHDLKVIEDAALGFDAYYFHEALGTLGDIGCFSFHSTKNVTCGEGGALVTKNDEIATRARIIREKGTNKRAFLHGEVDEYSWISKGSSYALSDLLAAILEVQFTRRLHIRRKRRAIWDEYRQGLALLEAGGHVILPDVPPGRDPNFLTFFFNTQDAVTRNLLLSRLNSAGIGASFHYVPLHESSFGRKYATAPLPITEIASRSLIRLPIYPDLEPHLARRVIRAIEEFFVPTQREYDMLQQTATARHQIERDCTLISSQVAKMPDQFVHAN